MIKHRKKKFYSIVALALCGSILTACGNTDNTVVFTPYWNSNINAPETDAHQTFEYKVEFKKGVGAEGDYLLDYTNGKYKTELSMEKLENGTYVYSFATTFSVDATYTFNNGSELQTFTANDTTETLVKFHLTKQYRLRPISSYKKITGTTPLYNIDYEKLEDCYSKLDYTIQTSYAEDGKSGLSEVSHVEDGKTIEDSKTFKIGDKYSYLDNDQLLFAIRGINPQEKSAAKFYVYAPFSEVVQKIKVNFFSPVGEDFTFKINGTEKKQTIHYYPVSIGIDAKNAGETQTAWYASYKDNAALRNVMLRLEIPLHYSLGSFVYTLENANFGD